jgi:hypothetical protein
LNNLFVGKKAYAKILVIFLFAAIIAGVLSGCNQGEPWEEESHNVRSTISLFEPRVEVDAADVLYNAILNRDASSDLSSFRITRNDTEANVARFGFDEERPETEIRKIYPNIGYTYTTNARGMVIKVGSWKK